VTPVIAFDSLAGFVGITAAMGEFTGRKGAASEEWEPRAEAKS